MLSNNIAICIWVFLESDIGLCAFSFVIHMFFFYMQNNILSVILIILNNLLMVYYVSYNIKSAVVIILELTSFLPT